MINDFKGKFQDVARLNRFRVEGARIAPNAIVMSATLPGESFNTEMQRDPDKLGGNPFKFPVDIIQNDASITFINDSLYTQRTIIDDWWKEIYDPAPGQGFGYWEEYKSDVKIIQLNRQNAPIYTCTLIDAYPIMYSDIMFDASPESGLSIFTVTFAYSDIRKEPGGGGNVAVPAGADEGVNAFEEILRGVLGSI